MKESAMPRWWQLVVLLLALTRDFLPVSTVAANDDFNNDDFYGSLENSAVPTETPSLVPSFAPSLVPFFAPSLVPTCLPTYAPTTAPSAPSIAPSTRFPTFGGTSPPSNQEGYIILFNQAIGLGGLSVSTLNSNSRLAITTSVSSLMDINDDNVVYNGDNFTIMDTSSRRLLRGGSSSGAPSKIDFLAATGIKYVVTADLAITVTQALFPEFEDSPKDFYDYMTGLLTDSITSGDFYSKLVTQAAFMGSTELVNVTITNVTSFPFTVINYTAIPEDKKKKNNNEDPFWAWLKKNWPYLLVASILLSSFCYFCCAKKKEDDEEDDSIDDRPLHRIGNFGFRIGMRRRRPTEGDALSDDSHSDASEYSRSDAYSDDYSDVSGTRVSSAVGGSGRRRRAPDYEDEEDYYYYEDESTVVSDVTPASHYGGRGSSGYAHRDRYSPGRGGGGRRSGEADRYRPAEPAQRGRNYTRN